ncbi:hypothetical protein EI94DRAFT_1015639 [Lactarius quietus]|nr:hypothetical protein EI94DRAFT_1015639 [Lactarius quietus]
MNDLTPVICSSLRCPAAPYPPYERSRRLSHSPPSQPTATSSSSRRSSLPEHTPPQSTHKVSIATGGTAENSESFNDDLYSHNNLNAFSFGAPTIHHDTDMPSPLSVQAPSESVHSYSTGSTDRTPHPRISHMRDSCNSGGEDETRRIGGKMQAIDEGGPRHPLPTYQYTSDRPNTDDLASPSSRSNPRMSDSDSEPIVSANTSDIESDAGDDTGVVDTDVELTCNASDDASQRTFGLAQRADWYIVDPNDHRQEAGSPVTFRTDDDYSSDVSESGSRGLAALRRSSISISREFLPDAQHIISGSTDLASTHDRSFHATNSDIMPIRSHARQREDSTTTLAPPSYNDAEGDLFITLTSSSEHHQRPLPRTNWTMFGNTASLTSTDNSSERVYQGIDLDYIMNVGDLEDQDRRLSLRRSSLSFMAPWAEVDDVSCPRRTSTVTLEDSFAGHLDRDDPDYTSRLNDWSFVRERVSLPIREPDGSSGYWDDVWRCSQIGQIHIERATLPPSDPNKPNQQRLNAEHDVDPDSANSLGGPTTVVHRHSKALAFSIYRYYNLEHYPPSRTRNSTTTVGARTPRSSESRTITMPMHDGILFATKRVQERFTNTKSTAKLQTYGLLPEDGDDRFGTSRHPTNFSDPRRSLEKDWSTTPRHFVDVSKFEGLDSQASSIRGATKSDISGSSLDLSGITKFASSHSTSQSISSAEPIVFASETSSISERHFTPQDDAEEDSDNEFVNPAPRTSHAEAFATLDRRAMDQLRNEQVPAPALRRSQGWIQRFTSATRGSTPRTLSSRLVAINPPWMTLTPRPMQEEAPEIPTLSSSFNGVRLVPSTRLKGDVGIGREGKGKNKDMLTQVPDDSLYMLLPLWPQETDPASAEHEQRQKVPSVLDQEQNLYLLVYYVSFDKQGEGRPIKKRSRLRPRKGERERQQPTPQFDVSRGFKVIGRLIAREDLNGAGIRLPVRGLSVTGSLAEAKLGIPPASLRDVHPDDFVIGACLDCTWSTIEFFPEGLEKLGLCVPRAQPPGQLHTDPGLLTGEPPVDEATVFQPLTAIGRAAVEIAWLGCMALMTFYGPKPQGPT